MVFHDYFQSYNNYFWQWEDNVEVIAIPNENTIAYRELVIDVFEKLTPQGMPPFGSLLLAIIATNPKGNTSLDVVYKILFNSIKREENSTLSDAISFLKLLSEVPKQYKEGKNRILLFQAIFEQCHNTLSSKKSRLIRDSYHNNKHEQGKISKKKDFNLQVFNKDFRTIGLLKNKFQNVNDIINKIASLPYIADDLIISDKDIAVEDDTKDFVEKLIDNNKTFYVGSLVKRIWSGLNIPVNSALPSQQPLGGFSDLTNKGDYDKLLVSEFANDDIVFLSRLANSEALYMHREIPPTNNNQERIILIDISLKNWGTSKAIAFATMLAIAKHPKTTIECKAFAIGNSYYPISIESIDTIIDGLQLLEGSLNAARGLSEFFKDNAPDKNREVFIITEPSTLKQVPMLKAMNEYHLLINYWIYTDSEGNIDVYKKQQNSKKHIQHIKLPLEVLWKKESNFSTIQQNELGGNYAILFRNSLNSKKLLASSDGEIFQVTGDKMLLRFFDKLAKPNEKGWEMLDDSLPFATGEFEIGFLPNGNHVFLMFNPQNKEITLLNINTNEKKNISFKEWKSTAWNSFVFHDQKFYHFNNKGCWSISTDGKVEQEDENDKTIFVNRDKELKSINQKYSNNAGVLKNINSIFINESNNLVFNIHELTINVGYHIKLDRTNFLAKRKSAKKMTETEFEFEDGSKIEINRCGMLILKSSNPNIPFIYIPSILDSSLGVATDNAFAGNDYYYMEPQYDITLINSGSNIVSVIKIINELLGIGLKEAKDIADSAPKQILKYTSEAKATHIKTTLESNGATVKIKTVSRGEKKYLDLEKITTKSFFENYITAFISNVQPYGVTN